jgi:hypothetical protein
MSASGNQKMFASIKASLLDKRQLDISDLFDPNGFYPWVLEQLALREYSLATLGRIIAGGGSGVDLVRVHAFRAAPLAITADDGVLNAQRLLAATTLVSSCQADLDQDVQLYPMPKCLLGVPLGYCWRSTDALPYRGEMALHMQPLAGQPLAGKTVVCLYGDPACGLAAVAYGTGRLEYVLGNPELTDEPHVVEAGRRLRRLAKS